MICVSIARAGYEACLKALEGLDFAEIRLDMAGLDPGEARRLFACGKRLIATFRPGADETVRVRTLLAAIEGGAAYVDVELEAGPAYRRTILDAAKAAGCQVILSHHDFDRTPGTTILSCLLASCFQAGADVAKIACRVRTEQDAARLLGLLDTERKVVVVGMGPLGTITRLAAPLLGAPFTFASLEAGEETAPGQVDRQTLERLMESLAAGGRPWA